MVRLHPRAFREQFGEEMMWIFEEAAETHGRSDCSAMACFRSRASGLSVQGPWKSGDRRRCFHLARAGMVCLGTHQRVAVATVRKTLVARRDGFTGIYSPAPGWPSRRAPAGCRLRVLAPTRKAQVPRVALRHRW